MALVWKRHTAVLKPISLKPVVFLVMPCKEAQAHVYYITALLFAQVIDPVCGRHTAVLSSTKVLLKLSNGPEEPEVMIVPRHKKFEGAGKKATTKTKVQSSPVAASFAAT